jgi:hypothetical protein
MSKILNIVMAGALAAACMAPMAMAQGRGRGPQEPAGPTPRFPEDPNLGVQSGKPNFGGKGMWQVPYVTNMQKKTGGVTVEQEPPFTPLGKKFYEENQANLSKDDPEGKCLPPGVPRMMYTPYPAEILQLPNRVVFIFEGGAHVWRNIWMDGRQHTPIEKLNPTYLGESIGHWEGDTLVVDVTGFNTRTWLDAGGHQHTEQLHVVERYTREFENVMHYQVTIEDPGAYSKPWSAGWRIAWMPGMEPLEYVCQELNKDVVENGGHMVGLRPGEKHD